MQLLARLRRGEDIDSLLEAGRQMLRTRDGTYEPTVRSIARRASVDGIIPIVPLEARSMSDHLAAIVASTPLTVLEPNVDLAINLRNLDAAEYVSPTLRHPSLGEMAYPRSKSLICSQLPPPQQKNGESTKDGRL